MYPLCILNGSVDDVLIVSIRIDAEREFQREVHFAQRGGESCVAELHRLCASAGIQLSMLRACILVGTNERFTIARMMQVIANALAFSCQISVYEMPHLPSPQELEQVQGTTQVFAHYAAQPTMN